MGRILPDLLSQLRSKELVGSRPAIIRHLTTLLQSCRELPDYSTTSLAADRDELVSILASASSIEASRLTAFQALAELVQLKDYLSAAEKSYIIATFNSQLETYDPENADFDQILLLLVKITPFAGKAIESSTLPILFKQLPDQPTESSQYIVPLSSLAQLCLPSDLFEILVLRLIARLELVCELPASNNANVLYAHHLLTTLRIAALAKWKAGHTDLPTYAKKLLPRLFDILLRPIASTSDTSSVAGDLRILDDAGQLMACIVRTLDEAYAFFPPSQRFPD